MYNRFKFIVSAIMLILFCSCNNFLNEKVFTEYDPDEFLKDKEGIAALLNGAYSATTITGYRMRDNYMLLGELPTDICRETSGGLYAQVVPIMQFIWDPSTSFFNSQYVQFYSAISRINNVINVANSLTNEATKTQINAEARFLRAMSYYGLHNLFGPTPIIQFPDGASVDEIESIAKTSKRSTEEEYHKYVEDDLLYAIKNLQPSEESTRATKGSALALLTRFYLNNKEWQKAADAAKSVIDLGIYSLYNDYSKLFSIEGEKNKEFIYRFECIVGSGSPQVNNFMAHSFPPNYNVLPNWANYGADFKYLTSFYDTFESQDVRKSLFLTEYIPKNSTNVIKLDRDINGKPLDNIASFKYVPDPNADGEAFGNDIPYIRYADIILARAEALNELSGPSQQSIDLINQVRIRSHATPISLTSYSDKDALRAFILAERGREFYNEGLRREDLIRQGKFIQQAIDRGIINAKAFHVLYPIPQPQIDNNPNLVQNPGYK